MYDIISVHLYQQNNPFTDRIQEEEEEELSVDGW